MRHWLLGAVLLAAPLRAADEPVAVATASKAEVTVGETFTVEVQARGPAGTTFTFPPEITQETFELRTAAGESPPPPAVHRYQATVFGLGDAQVPPIPVRYRLPDGTEGEVKAAAIALKVVSLLPRDKEQQKLADVRGPVEVAIGRAFWAGVAGLLLLVAGLVLWLRSRRHKNAAPVVPPVPALAPDEEALRALDALVASGRLARAEYRPFYIELAAIVKRYLERRLEAPILEMTTAEMLAHLRANPQAVELVSPLRDLAGAADQIKFARGAGQEAEAERHLAAVRGLVKTLEARLQPAAPEGGRAA
jgi:hypothetical protein